MATLYVTEFSAQHTDQGRPVPISYCPAIVRSNNVAIGAAASSLVLNVSTSIVRLHSDAICSIVIGKPPLTATTADARMAQNQTEYFGVEPGYGYVVSVIANV